MVAQAVATTTTPTTTTTTTTAAAAPAAYTTKSRNRIPGLQLNKGKAFKRIKINMVKNIKEKVVPAVEALPKLNISRRKKRQQTKTR